AVERMETAWGLSVARLWCDGSRCNLGCLSGSGGLCRSRERCGDSDWIADGQYGSLFARRQFAANARRSFKRVVSWGNGSRSRISEPAGVDGGEVRAVAILETTGQPSIQERRPGQIFHRRIPGIYRSY